MLTLQEHIQAESTRWAASRGKEISYDERSTASSTTASTADSIFSSTRLHSKYNTHTLSRRSSTSSFATEFEPEPQQQQPFVVPRDFNGAPITVYASLEAAVAAQSSMLQNQGTGQGAGAGEGGGGEVREEQPRRLVTPGKLYENEEDDDEIVYD
ncbi:hypothetical protein FHL15_001913 [Xylaria flabelliformis]|uniref:Uncharacterized protein n=1 Tax=Xylaria flabelliformis TaxID=2512241 RepID=A0A553IA90_9PEZI|nr:hypothetical protein FHL15_001913 [Xylaria flabelliformis]